MTLASLPFETPKSLDVVLKKSLFKSLRGSSIGADDYHNALNSWADEKVSWHPMFRGVLSNATLTRLPYCSTLDTFAPSFQYLFNVLYGQCFSEKFSGIPQPKNIPHYAAHQREATSYFYDKEGEDTVRMYIYYGANMVFVEEEVLLLDAVGLVANLGGWLGLLIGVSCYGGITEGVDFIARRFRVLKRSPSNLQ